MYDIRRHFATSVREYQGTVTIDNINTRNLINDIERVWGTKVVTNNIFKTRKRTSVSFYSFFVPDLYCTIAEVLSYKGSYMRTPKSNLRLILTELENNTWYKEFFAPPVDHFDYSVLKQMKFNLLPRQQTAVKNYEHIVKPLQLKGYLLAAGVGTGKSVMSLALSLLVDVDITIIVCPLSIIDTVWAAQLDEQFGDKKRIWRSDKNLQMDNSYDYYLVHHEGLEKAITFFKTYKFKKVCIVNDESHYLNDMSSARTQRYIEMCTLSGSQNIIHCSGTAIKALASEAIPLFKVIDPLFTPAVEETFKAVYSRSPLRTLKILNHRIGLVSHKILKEEVMGDVPKPITIELKVKLPDGERYTIGAIRGELDKFVIERNKYYATHMPEHVKIYKDAVNKYYSSIMGNPTSLAAYNVYVEYIETMRKGYDAMSMGPLSTYCNMFEKDNIMPLLSPVEKKEFSNSKSVYKYVSLKIMGEFLGGVLGLRRAQLHTQLIRYSGIDRIVQEAERKTICFTDYVDTAAAAKIYFEEQGFQPLIVYSETNRDIVNIMRRFREGDVENPLIATIKSFGVGTTAITATVVIFLNQPFRAYEHEQAVARVSRYGQLSQVYVYNILLDTGLEGNLSTRMQEIQKWSKDQTDAMLGADINQMGLEQATDYILANEDMLLDIDDINLSKFTALNWK